jgi:hypothetical protein
MGSSIAKRTTTAAREKPIAEVVVEIRRHLHGAACAEARRIKHRLAAGQLLLRLRQRIEAGEEGDVAWWALANTLESIEAPRNWRTGCGLRT